LHSGQECQVLRLVERDLQQHEGAPLLPSTVWVQLISGSRHFCQSPRAAPRSGRADTGAVYWQPVQPMPIGSGRMKAAGFVALARRCCSRCAAPRLSATPNRRSPATHCRRRRI
jgi:hypothetical protein